MPKRKPKVFYINHKKTKKQQRQIESLSVPLRHLPESLNQMKLFCNACSSSFPPTWFQKQELPIRPVRPKYEKKGVKYTGPGRLIPTGVSQKCPYCDNDVVVDIPSIKMKTRGSLYGDDAHRNYGKKHVYIYSLVGADQSLLPELENSIKELKNNICPSKPPDSWSLHMKELWSGGHRKKHEVFRELSFDDVKNITKDICSIIKKQKLFVYNIALQFTSDRISKKNITQFKSQAYILLVLNAIDEWTTKHAQPHIFFDAEKSSEANQIIHKWAQDAFVGSQHSLLYGFLAKGIEIPEPKFVKPASYPGLEVADFVSYTIARYYFSKWQSKNIDIDPAEMGLATYLGFGKHGHLIWRRQEGYPWDFFDN